MKRTQNNTVFLIGEDMHILNPVFQTALEDGNLSTLVRMAERQQKGGAMALDLNPGPARSLRGALPKIIETVQEQVDLPFFLPAVDTALLEKTLRLHRGRATINAATAEPGRLDELLRLCLEFDAGLVVLLTRPGLLEHDVARKLQIALEVLEQADRIGFPFSRLYLDPVFSIRTDPVTWKLSGGMPDLEQILEIITLIGELGAPETGTLLALSNGTLGLPPERRSALHCRMLPLLIEAGLDAVLCNCCDPDLMKTARSLRKPDRLQRKAA